MRAFPLVLVLAAGFTAWGLTAPAVPGAPVHKGLKVHEWGVLRVHEDVDMANADMRAVWDGLPKFVYGQVTGRNLPLHWHNVQEVDKPVLFFHTPAPVEVRLRIDFAGGIPGVWWPGTQRPAVRDGHVVSDGPPGKPSRSLEWRLHVKAAPLNERKALPPPPVDDGHWVKTLRGVRCDEVFAHVGEEDFGYEREKFVYYDGLLPRRDWLAVTVHKGGVGVRSRVKHPVFDLTAVDRRVPGRTRVARVLKVEAGAEVRALDFAEVDAAAWPGSAVRALTAHLRAAGLLDDEAGSLVELWRRELFEVEGLTVFYRLPQEEYERLLPLKMTPRPEELVRVGLVQHPHCEPDLAERVARLARDLDADEFAVREEAQKRLEALGRAAFVHLRRLVEKAPSPEVRRRIERLLQTHDAGQALGR